MTPQTDAAEFVRLDDNGTPLCVVRSDFARLMEERIAVLERECAGLRSALAEASGWINSAYDEYSELGEGQPAYILEAAKAVKARVALALAPQHVAEAKP